MNNFDLEKEMPLDHIEMLMKELYRLMTGLPSDNILQNYIKSILPKDYDGVFDRDSNWTKLSNPESYSEEAYIPAGYDVAFIKHGRYSPANFHTHNFFEILCVINGNCTNYIASHQLELQAGDICIIAPNTQHALSALNDECIAYNLLVRASTFDKTFFGTLAEKDILASFFSKTLYGSEKPESYILFHTLGDEEVMNYFALAYKEYKDTRNYKARMLNSIINMFFITLLRNHEKEAIIPNPEGKSPDNKIIAILNHIQANYKTLTMSELSTSFNYSERHLTRLLKEYTGDTFVNIIQSIKIKKAAELLTNPDISIQEIIHATGYTDISHFYRVFRKHYSMTPIQYRNKNS